MIASTCGDTDRDGTSAVVSCLQAYVARTHGPNCEHHAQSGVRVGSGRISLRSNRFQVG